MKYDICSRIGVQHLASSYCNVWSCSITRVWETREKKDDCHFTSLVITTKEPLVELARLACHSLAGERPAASCRSDT